MHWTFALNFCIELLDETSVHWTFALNFYIELLIQNFSTLNFCIELLHWTFDSNFSTLNFCIEVMVQKFNALNLCIDLSEQNFNIMIFHIDLFTLNFCSKTSMHWTLVHSVTYSSELLRIGFVVQLWDWRFVTANWFCRMLRAFMWTAFEPTPHQSKQVGLHLERIAGNIYINSFRLLTCWENNSWRLRLSASEKRAAFCWIRAAAWNEKDQP